MSIGKLAALILMLCLGATVRAHDLGLSQGEYGATREGVRARIGFNPGELALAVPALDADGDGRVTRTEVDAARAELHATLPHAVEIRAHDRACEATVDAVTYVDERSIEADLHWPCVSDESGFEARFTLFDRLLESHRHIALVGETSAPTSLVLSAGEPEFAIALDASTPAATPGLGMIALGVHHVLTGYDHLMFLLGLVIFARGWKALTKIITAFTVGHSVSLAVAVLGWWVPPSKPVEAIIALSIAFIALENWSEKGQRRRVVITLLFGLVHGFGFAGALGALSFPKAELPLALFSFNVGVEGGQLIFLAVTLPSLYALDRWLWFKRWGRVALNTVVACAGTFWFVQRILA